MASQEVPNWHFKKCKNGIYDLPNWHFLLINNTHFKNKSNLSENMKNLLRGKLEKSNNYNSCDKREC